MQNEDKYLGKYLDDRYEILEVIGDGGMSVVYKAMCHRLNRLVAVKVLKDELVSNKEFRRRFQTEAHAVAMLSHPNIVAVYDVSHTSDSEYIVMELINGITLKQYMQRRGSLTQKEILHFTIQITKALSHAHSRGIVHRDIKPHNIMILRDSSVKVADFGIARLLTATQPDADSGGEAIGSVHYVSPEQAKGEVVDARSDIYSLGVVMYEMLTGRLPFEGDSPMAIAVQHMSSIPLSPREINPEIPVELERITMKAMNPKLSDRYQTADELMDDLEALNKSPSELVEMSPKVVGSINPPPEPEEIEWAPKAGRSLPVAPIISMDDLSRADYIKSRRTARRISLLTGIFLVLVFMVGAFLFLWNYWLQDVFSENETMPLPNFVNAKLEDVLMNSNYTNKYNFTVVYAVNEDLGKGYVVEQNPVAGRSVVKSDKGVDVTLTVSSGSEYTTVPKVAGEEYRQATIDLERLKLVVKESRSISASVEKDHVISTTPAAGEKVLPGSTVYIVISDGASVNYVTMPTVTGIDFTLAISRIESAGFKVGKLTLVVNDAAVGTVVFQTPVAGIEVAEGRSVDLQISGGSDMIVPVSSAGT
jgi:eukaryotic-like serine/threonine-protein kinase